MLRHYMLPKQENSNLVLQVPGFGANRVPFLIRMVDSKLKNWQHEIEGVLFRHNVITQHVFQHVVLSFILPICLWVVGSRFSMLCAN